MRTAPPVMVPLHSLAWPAFLGLAFLAFPGPAAAEESPGAKIYRMKCAICHGPKGEGGEEYPVPLEGDRSLAQLAQLIAKTMPKDTKNKCTADEARQVAAYIYDAFYSPIARARNKPARIELSRLTVRQYRNALADLVGSFRTPGRWDEKRGLHGEYYNSRRFFRNNERLIDRIDPFVQFDFGEAGPEPKFDPNTFSIRWEGSVLATETGEHEFIVRTEHAARLWVNDNQKPLIDAWVKSGNDTEFKAALFLVAGRAYPLRLEFSKAKQGVDDSKTNKNKPKPVKASIALEWKLPGRTPTRIPQRCLTPNRFPVQYVCGTPFPPDDRSIGYERGTSISKAWDQATTDSAIDVARYVVANLAELAGVRDDAADRRTRVRDFCLRFAERAFRRPLSEEQKQIYVERQFAAGGDLEMAVKRVVLLVLKSPRFLYREIGGLDPWNVASRISFGLWDSLPDQELLSAAANSQLGTREQVARQAERLATDPRAHAKVHDFFLQWLKVDQLPDLSKDPAAYPGFDLSVASDLRTSLELFLDEVIWSDVSDFRQLLLSESLYLNGRLARIYGVSLPENAPFQRVEMKPGRRSGVLTHPYLLAAFAYTSTSSPIHRGIFLARSVLGQSLRPPPEAAAPLAPDLHPQLTTRERVMLQTKPQACQTCHALINPLGFTLENFDAIGRFRAREKGKPIDATGTYHKRTGELVKFSGVRDLAVFLADCEETHDAIVEQLFQYLVKQPIRAFGPSKQAELRQAFTKNQYNIRKLLVDIIADSALDRGS